LQGLKGQGVEDCRFLSNKVLLVGNRTLPALELFTRPDVTTDGTYPTPMIQHATLGLPALANACYVGHMEFSYPLVKNGVTSNNHLHDTAIYVKPFISTSHDDIISVDFHVMRPYTYFGFFVHSSALQRYAHSNTASLQDMVPWHQWGPTATRWECGGFSPWTQLCGQRYLLPSIQEIWDFNQLRVRHLGKGFVLESKTTRLSVETEPSNCSPAVFKEPVCSSLPYVKIRPKEWLFSSCSCLDDDRVFGCSVGTNLEFFHFPVNDIGSTERL
jgi:hypothetical protein